MKSATANYVSQKSVTVNYVTQKSVTVNKVIVNFWTGNMTLKSPTKNSVIENLGARNKLVLKSQTKNNATY